MNTNAMPTSIGHEGKEIQPSTCLLCLAHLQTTSLITTSTKVEVGGRNHLTMK